MSEGKHDLVLKLIALGLGLLGLVLVAESLSAGGAFAKASGVLGGLLTVLVALGFARYRGWAFLLVSAGLLVGFLAALVALIVSFDTKEGTRERLLALLLILALIGYLGRWSMERRFRPHLDQPH